jgi:hypothetical protein
VSLSACSCSFFSQPAGNIPINQYVIKAAFCCCLVCSFFMLRFAFALIRLESLILIIWARRLLVTRLRKNTFMHLLYAKLVNRSDCDFN